MLDIQPHAFSAEAIFPHHAAAMKLLFLTPPMENWRRWGSKHVTANPLHTQRAAYARNLKRADTAILDCRALELDAAARLERVKEFAPDAVFLGTRLVTDGGAW